MHCNHKLGTIFVIYVLKNAGKLVVNTRKIQGKRREFNLNPNVATLLLLSLSEFPPKLVKVAAHFARWAGATGVPNISFSSPFVQFNKNVSGRL